MNGKNEILGIKDSDWIRRSFLTPSNPRTTNDILNEIRNAETSVSYKFTDTSLGGNFAINPPPQFAITTDLPVKGKYAGDSLNGGMGRYYSEALDDHGQFIHMRFGVGSFNSLTTFFTQFYNAESGMLANRGRSANLLSNIGKVIGYVVSLPLKPIIWTGQITRFFMRMPASKYYYLKPTMHLYWSAVSTMVNTIAVNMGVIGDLTSEGELQLSAKEVVDKQITRELNAASVYSNREIFKAYGNFSEIFNDDGSLDIFKVCTKAARLSHKQREKIDNLIQIENLRYESTLEAVSAQFSENFNKADAFPTDVNYAEYMKQAELANSTNDVNVTTISLDQKVDDISGNERTLSGTAEYTGIEQVGTPSSDGITYFDSLTDGENVDGNNFWQMLKTELQNGSAFATFRVDNPGTTGESFSSSVGESQIANTINSMSQTGRVHRFNFMDGNTGFPVIDPIIRGIRDVIHGVAEGVQMSGLLSLAGNAFADIPKVWESSSVSLPSSSYTIELRSPYGNPISRLQNLIVPLAMLLAGAMPLSTGKRSYTSPFLLELYSKGRNQIRLGIIDSLSITRGTGNLGWNDTNNPLGIDISFSVTDLSTIMHMPLISKFNWADAAQFKATEVIGDLTERATGVSGNELASILSMSNFDDDNSFNDYMCVLGSLSLSDQVYPRNKLKLRALQRSARYQQWTSPYYHANWMVHGTMVGRIAAAVSQARNPPSDRI